jgi:hypothetical protein
MVQRKASRFGAVVIIPNPANSLNGVHLTVIPNPHHLVQRVLQAVNPNLQNHRSQVVNCPRLCSSSSSSNRHRHRHRLLVHRLEIGGRNMKRD